MKKMIVPAAVFVLTQLLIGYIVWDINPANWGNAARAGSSITGIILAAATYALREINK